MNWLNDLLRRILFLPEQGSQFARSVDHFHFFVWSVSMLGAAATLSAAVFFVVRYRRRATFSSTWMTQALPAPGAPPTTWVRPSLDPSTCRGPAAPRRCVATS